MFSATPAQAHSLCAPPADTVPPQVTSVTFSTQSVDLSSGRRTVTVSAHATDTSANGAASGVKRIDLDVSGPRGSASAKLSLASGTAADGEWTGTLTIPKNGRAGTWTLRNVTVRDADRNYQTYSSYDAHAQSPTDIRLQTGWDTSITVTGSGPPPPVKVKPGRLTAFDFTPTAVDTTHTAKTVHVTAKFTAPYPRHVYLDFEKSLGKGRFYDRIMLSRTSGGGHWAGHITVHRWIGHSQAVPQLTAVYGATVSPRFKNLSAVQLSARHFPTALRITSGVDKTKPTLDTLSFSPSSVDTTSGPQTVTVRATGNDTKSGLKDVEASLYIHHGQGGAATGFYPYPGLGYAQSSYLEVRLKPQGNAWVGNVTVRECVPSGDWKARVSLDDRAGNYQSYRANKLAAAGLPSGLPVTSTPGDVEPPAIRDATASGADHTMTLDFTEGVQNVNTSTLSVFAMKPAASRFEQTASVTGISCSNGTSDVDCSGGAGLVTSAVLTVPDLSGGARYEVFGNLDAITAQLTDGAGNPLDWDYRVADVTGS